MIREFELLPEYEELHNTDFYKANKHRLPDYKELAYEFTVNKMLTVLDALFVKFNLSKDQIKDFCFRGIEEPESYKGFYNSLALELQKNTLANDKFIKNLQRTSDAGYQDQIVRAELNDNSKPTHEKIKIANNHFNIESEICKIIDDCTPDRDLARSKIASFQADKDKYMIKWFDYLKDISYKKDIENLILLEKLDKHEPPQQDSILNEKHLIKILDYITENPEKFATRALQKAIDNDKYLGVFKTWEKFFQTKANTIRRLTGEAFIKDIDALFAINKHRDKIKILFETTK